MRDWIRLIVGAFLAALIALQSTAAYSVEPDEVLEDPVLEERAREISSQLRCLVCQNQNIDSSDAPLAKDLRVLVRERLVQGDSNRQVIDYVVDRYGEFALLQPRVGWHTMLLWGTPFLALILGLIVFYARTRSTVVEGQGEALSEAEQREITKILGERDR